jgi:hypothetical protein
MSIVEETLNSYMLVEEDKALGLKCIEEEKVLSLKEEEVVSLPSTPVVLPGDYFQTTVLPQLVEKVERDSTPSLGIDFKGSKRNTGETPKTPRPEGWVYSLPGKENMAAAIRSANEAGITLRASVKFPWYTFYVGLPGRYMEDTAITSLNCKTAISAVEIFLNYNALVCLYERFVTETIDGIARLDIYPKRQIDEVVGFSRAWLQETAKSLDLGCGKYMIDFKDALTRKSDSHNRPLGPFILGCVAEVTLKGWMNCIELFCIKCDAFCVFLDTFKASGRVSQDDVDYHFASIKAVFIKDFIDYEMLVKSNAFTGHLPIIDEKLLSPEEQLERGEVIAAFVEQQRKGRGVLNLPPQLARQQQVPPQVFSSSSQDVRQEKLKEKKEQLAEKVAKKRKEVEDKLKGETIEENTSLEKQP